MSALIRCQVQATGLNKVPEKEVKEEASPYAQRHPLSH